MTTEVLDIRQLVQSPDKVGYDIGNQNQLSSRPGQSLLREFIVKKLINPIEYLAFSIYNKQPPKEQNNHALVQFAQHDRGPFHFLRPSFSSHLKNRVGLTLTKAVVLRMMINIHGVPITSKSHTHPSHSQTSRLLTSSSSLGAPIPRSTIPQL
jgi:hypothetical protein